MEVGIDIDRRDGNLGVLLSQVTAQVTQGRNPANEPGMWVRPTLMRPGKPRGVNMKKMVATAVLVAMGLLVGILIGRPVMRVGPQGDWCLHLSYVKICNER